MEPRLPVLRRAALAALALAVVSTLGWSVARRASAPTGLQLEMRGPSGAISRAVDAVDARDVRDAARRIGLPVKAEWRGVVVARSDGRHRLVVESDAPAAVDVDGTLLVETRGSRARGDVGLREGPHDVLVRYRPQQPPGRLVVEWVEPGGARRALAGTFVFASVPSPRQAAAARMEAALATVALAAWAAVVALALGMAALLPPTAPFRRLVRVTVPVLVVAWAGALRFEALVGRYWHDAPATALALERAATHLRPAELQWPPSETHGGGDPFHYYVRARTMESFYAPHVREPLFPWTARQLGRWLGDRPLVVDVASALYATLAVLATFLLGLAAFGWTPGVAAAALLAVEQDAIWWGVEGFRDDAFTAFVALTAAALVRLAEQPTRRWALLAGLAAGLACLSRITAFSFLLPALVWCALGRDEQAAARRQAVALAFAVCLALVGPYMASCAIAYGDPFHAVNHHTRFYRSRSGAAFDSDMSWSAWLGSFEPARLATTGVQGLTTVPFRSKWHGLDPALGATARRALTWLSVVGLVLLALCARGRLLLLVLVTSLLPYAFTWSIPGGAEWRFTMPAYPFYLVAAVAAVPALRDVLRRYGSAPLPWRGTEPGPPPG